MTRTSSTTRKYKSVFANGGHKPICTWEDFRGEADWWGCEMGLFCDGVYVGSGTLKHYSKDRHRRSVHTTNVALIADHQKKGHGVPLYLAFIRTAKRLGAQRIYSDYRLNRHSKRMWIEKLAKIFTVKHTLKSGRPKCSRCRHCVHGSRFYIDLTKEKLVGAKKS
jgi:GNAT superfamily N-acetyltransferase